MCRDASAAAAEPSRCVVVSRFASRAPLSLLPTATTAYDASRSRARCGRGWGQYGQLGLGKESDEVTAATIEALRHSHVVELRSSGTSNSTAALTASGDLYTFGSNGDGRLGHGVDAPNQDVPRAVDALRGRKVVSVAVGECHMLALDSDGTLWSFGKSRQGQLGHADGSKPSAVSTLKGVSVVSISAGRHHSAAVDATGTAYTWGEGSSGALGQGSKDNKATPTKVLA